MVISFNEGVLISYGVFNVFLCCQFTPQVKRKQRNFIYDLTCDRLFGGKPFCLGITFALDAAA